MGKGSRESLLPFILSKQTKSPKGFVGLLSWDLKEIFNPTEGMDYSIGEMQIFQIQNPEFKPHKYRHSP